MASDVTVCGDAYRDILRAARRFARSAEDARDLAQDALVIALTRGFDDWSSPERRAWLLGVIRKRAAFLVRGQRRRRRREERSAPMASEGGAWAWQPAFLESLPASLRAVASLANADLCAAEIRWLLGLSDTALRQRLSALRRAVRAAAEDPKLPTSGSPAAFGERRADALAVLRRQRDRAVATYDPDGHVILLRNVPHRTAPPGNDPGKEPFECPHLA